MEQLIEDPLNDPLGEIELDFDLMAEFFAKLTPEEFDELLYPFGK